MRAFVLSGGGNLGPLQLGALRALLEHGIYPEMVVGCSAGSINGIPLAKEPSVETVDQLARNWGTTRLRDVYPGWGTMAVLRFLAGKDSLYTNRNFVAMFRRYGMTNEYTFGNYATLPLYVTATDLRTGGLKVFGDDPNDRILDAVMASTALTPLHPPWEVNGERFVDGGTITPLPIRVALERGATEIYALHIWDKNKDVAEPRKLRGVVKVLTRSVDSMLRFQAQYDLFLANNTPGVKLHHILLHLPRPMLVTDFGRAAELVESGYATTIAYLQTLPPAPAPVVEANPSVVRRALATLNALVAPRQSAPA
jgi:NTE family protein